MQLRDLGFVYTLTNTARFGASGVCGLGLPFLAEKALNTYGFVFTLRAYAVAIVSPP